jgi:hypothetical protein
MLALEEKKAMAILFAQKNKTMMMDLSTMNPLIKNGAMREGSRSLEGETTINATRNNL